jgi:transposase
VPTSGHRSSGGFTALATRRDWRPSEKRAIVAESLVPGANVSAIARRHGVAQSLLYRWRKTIEAGPPSGAAFVPVVISAPQPPAKPEVPQAAPVIEIALINGRTLKVAADIDTGLLARIASALERA